MDMDLPVEKIKRKLPPQRTKREQPANISVRDLTNTTPKFSKKLLSACRPKRKVLNNQVPQQTMAIIEYDDMDIIAVYSKVNIGNRRARILVDCLAAKTCMSKALADTLELSIDAASESVFTLGNGTKRPALGIIYRGCCCYEKYFDCLSYCHSCFSNIKCNNHEGSVC